MGMIKQIYIAYVNLNLNLKLVMCNNKSSVIYKHVQLFYGIPRYDCIFYIMTR